MSNIESLRQLLSDHKQQHLLGFWDQLNEEQKQLLYKDLKSIDLAKVCKAFEETVNCENETNETIDHLLEPLSSEVNQSITRTSKETLQSYRENGLRQISEGRVAALLLAGGQGTRLGVNYPKGMYDVGLPSKKTLYQLQGERILRLEKLAHELTGKNGSIPWYIMTSEATREPTIEFFRKHNYFGLKAENVIVFEQSTLPCFQLNGQIILETKYKVARAPDGNGGLYNALSQKGILDDMQKRGIQHIQVYCVDNILVKVADPTFIGYCVSKGAEAAAKVVQKAFPTEAVGIICKVRGKYKVVEYSEVSLQTAQKRNSEGRLTFDAGNICNHYFTLDFLRNKICGKDLIHHIAKKKIPFVDQNGQIVKPEKPNGIKLEKFVFDVFEFTDKFVVWEVLREDEFSPLKNGDGSDKDNPTTARLSVYNLHQRFVLNAGGKFVDENGKAVPLIASPVKVDFNGINGNQTNDNNNNHNESQVICEISPLISYDGEGLDGLVSAQVLRTPLILNTVEEPAKKSKANGSANGVQTNGTAVEVNGYH